MLLPVRNGESFLAQVLDGLIAHRGSTSRSSPSGRLAAQCAYLDRHLEIGVLGTQAWRIDVDGVRHDRIRVPAGPHRVRAGLMVSSVLIHPAVMMRRELLLAAGDYRPLFDGAEDYDLRSCRQTDEALRK